jgi:hypothetical protein
MGGARSDLFEVWILYPDKLKSHIVDRLGSMTAKSVLQNFFGGTGGEKIQPILNNLTSLFDPAGSRLFVKSAKIPKFGVGTTELPYKGRKFQYPTTREDDNTLQLGVYNDVHFLHHAILSMWLEFIRTSQTNIGLYPQDFFGSIKVFQHDSLGNVLKIINFVNVFPKEVGEIGLDWGDEKIEEFNATFGYHLQLTDTSDEIKVF